MAKEHLGPGNLFIVGLVGFLMSAGIGIGGMSHRSSLSFFDVAQSGKYSTSWSPGMLILFCSAMTPGFLFWWLFKFKKPLWASRFHISACNDVDFNLVFGSLIFALGWSVGGFCPGPSVLAMLSGHIDFVMFSYGLYVGILFLVWNVPQPHWSLTILLGFLPAFFYFVGPFLINLDGVDDVDSWPVHLSITGGLLIGLAAFILMLFNGKTLGLSATWRRVLRPTSPWVRIPELLFFFGFMAGAYFVYLVAPAAFLSPPDKGRHLVWKFVGGVLVAIGTEKANGCTSGHGVCGIPRFSIRSWVSVCTFMFGVFVGVPLSDWMIG